MHHDRRRSSAHCTSSEPSIYLSLPCTRFPLLPNHLALSGEGKKIDQKYSSVEMDPKRRAYVRRKIKPSGKKSKKKGGASEYTPVTRDGLPDFSRRRDDSDSDDESSRSSGESAAGPRAGGSGAADW